MSRRNRLGCEPLEGRSLLSGLTINLTTDRSTYTRGQPVQVIETQTNNTGQPVSVALSSSTGQLGITTPDGTGVYYPGLNTARSNAVTSLTLLPGESLRTWQIWNGQANLGATVQPTGPLVIHTTDGAATATITIVPGRTPGEYTPVLPTPPLTGVVGNPPVDTSASNASDVITNEVETLYRSILGRSADSQGLSIAVSQVQGGAPLSAIALSLLNSVEHDVQVATADYYGYLGRAGTPTEINAWVAAMRGGVSEQQVAISFLSSSEFSALHSSEPDFVSNVYRDLMGRDATPADLASAENQLASGTARSAIVSTLVNSTEAEVKAIQGLYQSALNRPVDQGGLQATLVGLGNGTATLDRVYSNLLGSSEHKLYQG